MPAPSTAPRRFEGTRVPHVYVTIADDEGWDIRVELDGRLLMTEHCTDWHRVERHRARLEAAFGQDAASDAVALATAH